MLRELEISTFPTRRTHRNYTRQFKAELVAACQAPGVSFAALAGQHGMNVNVLHRWLREHERTGCHLLTNGDAGASLIASPVAAFVALPLSTPAPQPASTPTHQGIKVELHKGTLSIVVTWPVSATTDFAAWMAAVLQ